MKWSADVPIGIDALAPHIDGGKPTYDKDKFYAASDKGVPHVCEKDGSSLKCRALPGEWGDECRASNNHWFHSDNNGGVFVTCGFESKNTFALYRVNETGTAREEWKKT